LALLIAATFLALSGCGKDPGQKPINLELTCSKTCMGAAATKAVACQVTCNDGFLAKCGCEADPELAKCRCVEATPL
jgi:hypothetical protein